MNQLKRRDFLKMTALSFFSPSLLKSKELSVEDYFRRLVQSADKASRSLKDLGDAAGQLHIWNAGYGNWKKEKP